MPRLSLSLVALLFALPAPAADWWHQLNVAAVEEKVSRGKYPRVARKVGKSLPRCADLDEDE